MPLGNSVIAPYAILLLIICSTHALAQDRSSPDELMAEVEAIAAEAEVEAKAAGAEAIRPENTEKRRAADLKVVNNAMRELQLSTNADLANEIPLPQFVGLDEINAVLSHENAWEAFQSDHHRNASLKESMAALSAHTGHLLYEEWACDTGRMAAVGKRYMALVDSLVTTYPERLMLQGAVATRSALGYGSRKECDRKLLRAFREDFENTLSDVLAAL